VHSDCAFANWLGTCDNICRPNGRRTARWRQLYTTVGTLRRHISAPLRRQLMKPSAVASEGAGDHFVLSGAAHL